MIVDLDLMKRVFRAAYPDMTEVRFPGITFSDGCAACGGDWSDECPECEDFSNQPGYLFAYEDENTEDWEADNVVVFEDSACAVAFRLKFDAEVSTAQREQQERIDSYRAAREAQEAMAVYLKGAYVGPTIEVGLWTANGYEIMTVPLIGGIDQP